MIKKIKIQNKRKIFLLLLIISLITITSLLIINSILFKNNKKLLNAKKENNKKSIKKNKDTKNKIDFFKNEIKKLSSNLNSDELKLLLDIFLDLYEDPIKKFDLKKIYDEIVKEDEYIKYLVLKKNSFFYLNYEKDKNNFLNIDNDEDDGSDLNDKGNLYIISNKLKIKNFFKKNKHILKQFLIKRIIVFNQKILIENIFKNLLNEKKSKIKTIKSFILQFISNLNKENFDLKKINKFKKNINFEEFDDEVNKLDIERFWLWIKSISRFNFWKTKNPGKEFFPNYFEIRNAGNYAICEGVINESINFYLYSKERLYYQKPTGKYLDETFTNQALIQESLKNGWGYIYKYNQNKKNLLKITNILNKIDEYLLNINDFLVKKNINLNNNFDSFFNKEKEIIDLFENFLNTLIINNNFIMEKIKENPYLNNKFFSLLKEQTINFEKTKNELESTKNELESTKNENEYIDEYKTTGVINYGDFSFSKFIDKNFNKPFFDTNNIYKWNLFGSMFGSILTSGLVFIV